MTHYIALVHKEKRSSYGVQFPDVPGCYSAADKAEDLIRNAAEALSLWAEDEILPPPRSIYKITADKSLARELAGGAFLISVPFSENDNQGRLLECNFQNHEEVKKRRLSEDFVMPSRIKYKPSAR